MFVPFVEKKLNRLFVSRLNNRNEFDIIIKMPFIKLPSTKLGISPSAVSAFNMNALTGT